MVLPSPRLEAELPANPAFIRYVNAAKQAQCPIGQIRNFLRANIVLQPRQLDASAVARLCDLPDGPTEIGYGGARGGGKSHWMLAQMGADDCQRFPGLKCLLLRKVGKANKESFDDLRRRLFGRLKNNYARGEGVLTFDNGSRIIAGHFQNESDIDAYLGLEYDIIGVEEATTLSSTKYRSIKTCCRTSKQGWRPRLYTTTNPGGIGHAWYKLLFVDPAVRGEQVDTYFIPATVDDNTFVNPEYRKTLDSLTGWQKRAWRHGDWDIAAGQFFTNWRKDIHVRSDFQLARNWRFWCALDYGFTHYTVVYLLVQDGDGRIFILDEHAERRWLTERHANAVIAMLARNDLALNRLYRFVAGADVFAQRMEGGTIAAAYADHKIRLEAANDDRITGAGKILQRLGDLDATIKLPDGSEEKAPIEPTLFVHPRCARLIECIPSLQHDPHRPEDVLKVDCDEDGVGGDDAYDAARYGCMVPETQKEEIVYAPTWGKAKGH
jgi:phage terminase large subunit